MAPDEKARFDTIDRALAAQGQALVALSAKLDGLAGALAGLAGTQAATGPALADLRRLALESEAVALQVKRHTGA